MPGPPLLLEACFASYRSTLPAPEFSVSTMPTPQTAHSPIDFAVAEDGEAIGTVRQFADRFDLPESRVLPCLRTHAAGAILLRADGPSGRLLMLDADGVGALLGCADSGPSSHEEVGLR